MSRKTLRLIFLSVGCLATIGFLFFALSAASKPTSITSRSTMMPLATSTTETPLTPLVMGESEIRILFVGDMMFDRNVARRIKEANDPYYPFLKIQKNNFLLSPDLTIGNLEGPVVGVKKPFPKSIDFGFATSVVDVIKMEGFDAVSQANNHSYDQGKTGADESRTFLRTGGLFIFGDEYRNDEEHALTILETQGKKIALIGFNATEKLLDRAAASKVIETAKREADQVIDFMHWGDEYQAKPNTSQKNLAHWFIDQGVTTVIGGHPHWMQSVEVYKNRPIVYSLGNFIFDQDFSEETQRGLAVEFEFNDSESKLVLHPVKIMESQPELLIGDELQKRLNYLASISDPSLTEQIKQGVISIKPK